MHKQELIDRLKRYTTKNTQWRGQKSFAEFLIHYLSKLEIPVDEQYSFWDIDYYLPKIMVSAFEELRTGTDEQTVKFRELHETACGHPVPNITDIGSSNLLDQAFSVQVLLDFLLQEVTEQKWIGNNVERYCNAQTYVLKQTFDKFTRLVYRRDMYNLINACKLQGMSGKFGNVELRTHVSAGRIMFTFAKRIDPSKKSHYKWGKTLLCNEWSVTFIGEDNDPLLLGAGIQSIDCDFRTSLDLIEEVIKNWPEDPKAQKKVFRANKKIAMI